MAIKKAGNTQLAVYKILNMKKKATQNQIIKAVKEYDKNYSADKRGTDRVCVVDSNLHIGYIYTNGEMDDVNSGVASSVYNKLFKVESRFLKDGGTVTDISNKLQGIVDGAFDYIIANCPQKPAYLQVGIRKNGNKYELTAYLGAGWYFAYPEKEKAYKWLEDLGKQVKAKYPQIEKFSMAGYGSSNVESKAHIDKEALSKQMNNPAYLKEKGLMKAGGNIKDILAEYKKHINSYYADGIKHFKNDKPMVEMYEKDKSDHETVIEYMEAGNWGGAYRQWARMDTASREEITPNAYDLLNEKMGYPNRYCVGGKMKTGGSTNTDRHNKMQKIKAFLEQFPNNATTWNKATDEVATLNTAIGDFIDNYKGDLFVTFGGELPNDTRLTPAKRNTNHKKIILKYLPKLSDRDFDTFYDNFADWFENKMGIGGGIKDFFAGTTVKTKNGEYWKPFEYSIGGL